MEPARGMKIRPIAVYIRVLGKKWGIRAEIQEVAKLSRPVGRPASIVSDSENPAPRMINEEYYAYTVSSVQSDWLGVLADHLGNRIGRRNA